MPAPLRVRARARPPALARAAARSRSPRRARAAGGAGSAPVSSGGPKRRAREASHSSAASTPMRIASRQFEGSAASPVRSSKPWTDSTNVTGRRGSPASASASAALSARPMRPFCSGAGVGEQQRAPEPDLPDRQQRGAGAEGGQRRPGAREAAGARGLDDSHGARLGDRDARAAPGARRTAASAGAPGTMPRPASGPAATRRPPSRTKRAQRRALGAIEVGRVEHDERGAGVGLGVRERRAQVAHVVARRAAAARRRRPRRRAASRRPSRARRRARG